MIRHRVAAALTAIAAIAAGLTVAPAATADAGPVFTVINTSETPPEGVWFRNSAHTNDTDRVTGHGVYAGEQVRLNCYEWGDAVGPYGNALWYQATNLTRPTVNGTPNAGHLNAHYVDDGQAANQIDPGVPPCRSTPPPSPPPPPAPALGSTVVFYSGKVTAGAAEARASGADRVLTERARDWLRPWETFDGTWPGSQQCTPSAAAANFGGLDVNRLAGWSLGRLGPIYALKYLHDHNDPQARRINYVVLYDPGDAATLLGGCDTDQRVDAAATLAWWLGLDADNRLVVMSADGPGGTITDRHAGIQQAYFPDLKAQGLYGQVLVCNYPQLDHEQVYHDYAWLLTLDRRLATTEGFTSCPPLHDGQQVWGWNPHP
jgi:hypothetical protein